MSKVGTKVLEKRLSSIERESAAPLGGTSMEDGTSSSGAVGPVRVLVADRTRMNSQLLANVLARQTTFQVLETEQPTEASILAAAGNQQPDVVLIGMLLDDVPDGGMRVARRLRATYPNIRVVMLLGFS